jgi:hypothetical protein
MVETMMNPLKFLKTVWKTYQHDAALAHYLPKSHLPTEEELERLQIVLNWHAAQKCPYCKGLFGRKED